MPHLDKNSPDLKPEDSRVTGLERTGEMTFNVTHDDGSIFEMKGEKRIVEELGRKKYRKPPAQRKLFAGVGEGKKGECEGFMKSSKGKWKKKYVLGV